MYTPEQRKELFAAIKADAKTMTVQEACDKHGVKLTTYYNWNKGKGKIGKTTKEPLVEKPKRAYRKRNAPSQLITIPLNEDNAAEFMCVILGPSKQVADAIAQLSSMRR